MRSTLVFPSFPIGPLLGQLRQSLEGSAEADHRQGIPVNIHRTEAAIELHALLPGIPREQIRLGLANRVLTIDADASAVTDASEWRFDAAPVNRTRRFHLAEEMDIQAITATHRDGVLIVTVPKRAEAAPRTIDIA